METCRFYQIVQMGRYRVCIEELADGSYLATDPGVPWLVAKGASCSEVLENAKQVFQEVANS